MTDLLPAARTTSDIDPPAAPHVGPGVSSPAQRRGAAAWGLTGWAVAAADLLLGASCHSCGEPAVGVCPECRAAVERRAPFRVPAESGRVLGPVTVASSVYDPILRQLISAHKDRQAWQLVRFLGDRLVSSVQHLLAEAGPEQLELLQRSAGRIALVPVPSTRSAVRRRGRDATAALAQRAARDLDLDCRAVSALRPIRALSEQSGLDARQRRRNLDGALGLRSRRVAAILDGGVPVVVVDDLTTTGATLAEAARALTAGGVEVLGAAVVAATARRHPG